MTTWTSDELNKVGTAEELEIASLRRDGTLRNQVTIWVVHRGDDLYVRSVNGPSGKWFRGAQVRHEGHIQAGDIDKDVTFVEADHGMATDHALSLSQPLSLRLRPCDTDRSFSGARRPMVEFGAPKPTEARSR